MASRRGASIVEQIVGRHVVQAGRNSKSVPRSGDFVSVKPAYVMTHDNTAAVMNKYKELGVSRFADARKVVFTLDHNVQDHSEGNLKKYSNIQRFAQENGVDFYPAGRGIGHQVLCEEGYVFPYRMVVASDSHSNMYGGLGCLGTPVVRTDAASIWATGKTWWQVPPIARVNLVGKLAPGVTGKDVIVALCGVYCQDEVLNHAVEFAGPGIADLSVDERLTIANMTTEWGALTGLFPVDDKTIQWYADRLERWHRRKASTATATARSPLERVNEADLRGLEENAFTAAHDGYDKLLTLDLSKVRPFVAGPNGVKTYQSADALAQRHVKVNKAYLVSCVNSRADDIALAASIVKGRKVAEGVEFYVAPASAEVLEESQARGDWDILLQAGAIPLPAGCGPCIGLGEGLLQAGEVGISATNRNFRGRMGSPDAEAFLASPSVVAESAIAGYIKAPGDAPVNGGDVLVAEVQEPSRSNDDGAAEAVALLDNFPRTMHGAALLCLDDNINTDGIYPGKYTYREDIDAAMQAKVVMENYDERFAALVQPGNILVAGFNFGTGSSREQAATALKHAGIQVVITGSVNETYKRNALNNGLLVLECAPLVKAMKAKYEARKERETIQDDAALSLDLERAKIAWGNNVFAIPPVGTIAQELILAGGLEPWIQQQLKAEAA